MQLSYKISTQLAGKCCFIHNQGVSTAMSSENVVIKVCCNYFKDEIEVELQKHFSADYPGTIRFQLAGTSFEIPKIARNQED